MIPISTRTVPYRSIVAATARILLTLLVPAAFCSLTAAQTRVTVAVNGPNKRAIVSKAAPTTSRRTTALPSRKAVPGKAKAKAALSASPQRIRPNYNAMVRRAQDAAILDAAAIEIVAEGRGRINYEAGVIKATGLGAIAPPTVNKSRSQDILDAREVALSDAIRSLSLAISQVRVTADTRVNNYVLQSDDIRTRMQGVLENAKVVEEKVLPQSGVYRVVVQAQINDGPHSLRAALALGEKTSKRTTRIAAANPAPTPAPQPEQKPDPHAPGAPAPDGAEYTSLLIDCRGLNIVACMSPRVYDAETGDEVYGTMNISPDYAIDPGIAAFPRSMSAARGSARAGNNPLVVRACAVVDKNRFYLKIPADAAARARRANETSHFFERTAVILLIDP